MKVLFLYRELSAYFLSCVNAFVKKYDVKGYIVYWPINKEAPFIFSFPDQIELFEKGRFNSKELLKHVQNTSPDLIYCSGWIDKDYLSICAKFNGKIPVVVGFDNRWKATVKQTLASVFNKITIHKYFSHCWIPGKPQLDLAMRLGFRNENILTGFYSCDYDFFNNLYLRYIEQKKKIFPHKFIFAGRYYDFKGINDLWNAFIELQNESPNDWELWCLGAGDIEPIVHPKIKHFGFVQPNEIEKYIAQTGVFVLPSRIEPWGVAVHEFAAAGFPLICTTEVGAADVFLKEGENGFLFKPGNVVELKKVLKKVMSIPDETLFEMGQKSAKLAEQITPDKWSDTLMSIISKNKAIIL